VARLRDPQRGLRRVAVLLAFVASAVALGISEGGVARASEPQRTEVPSLRTATSETFVNADGTMTTSMYGAPIHYRDSQGRWQRIGSHLVPATRSGYAWQNEAGIFSASFKALLGTNFLDFDVGGREVALTLNGAVPSVGQPLGSRIVYPGALPGVDAGYEILSDGLKETLSLQNRNAPHTFVFTLTSPDGTRLESSPEPDGSWSFFVGVDDAPLFVLTAPYASDSTPSGEARRGESPHAALSVTRVGNNHRVELTIDSAWLQDPRRRFPVLVDPTVSIQSGVQDASFNANCPQCEGAVSTRLNIGGDLTTVWRSAVQFDLGDIPSGANVNNAQLGLYYDGTCLAASSNCGSSAHQIDVHRITTSWSPKSTTAQITFDAVPAGTFVLPSGAAAQWMNWDVTPTVLGWLVGGNPQPNFGLLLKRNVESVGSGGPTPPSRTYVEATLQPKLDITYAGDGVNLAPPQTVRADGAELNWTQYNGAAPFAGYEIHRSAIPRFVPSEETLVATNNELAATSYRDTEAIGTAQTYKIVAAGAASNERTVTLPTDSRTNKTVRLDAAGKATYITRDVNDPLYCPNFGARDRLTVGTDIAAIHRALLSFDLASIPASAQLASATLALWQPTNLGFSATVNAHRLTRSWAEGTGKGDCTGDGATWTQAQPGGSWTSPGGDFAATPAASFASQPSQIGWQTFDLTALAQQWVSGQVPNYGVLLKFANESLLANHSLYYYSDDWTVAPTIRPRLTISYFTAPENSEPPSVLGYNFEGETLTADPGLWRAQAPVSYAYQWLRCHYYTGGSCVPITGATAASYVVPADDIAYSFRVDVTATNALGSRTEVSAASPPRYSWSYYESTTNRATLKAQGCRTRKHGRMGIVILDFGRPAYQNGAYGMVLFSGSFASNSRILGAMKSFVDGYNDVTNPNCIPAPQYRNRKLVLAWGTNNSFIPLNWWPPQPNQPNSREAGQRIAYHVQYLSDYMFRFELPMKAAGAMDIEFDPAPPGRWRSALLTIPFINGFGSIRTNPWFTFYDYGSLDGGPCNPPNCHQDWTTENQYYKAYGAPHNLPLPEIYFRAMAGQWARLSRWAVDNNRPPIYYPGITSTPGPGYLTPAQGWRELRKALRRRGLPQQNIPTITQIARAH
jgi:hypothetical protein